MTRDNKLCAFVYRVRDSLFPDPLLSFSLFICNIDMPHGTYNIVTQCVPI